MERIQTYAEFWPFYLSEHRNPVNRALHVWGTTAAALVGSTSLALGEPRGILGALVLGYTGAWVGHFLIEKNRPATFSYPLWSFISDFRMAWLSHTRKLQDELQRLGDVA